MESLHCLSLHLWQTWNSWVPDQFSHQLTGPLGQAPHSSHPGNGNSSSPPSSVLPPSCYQGADQSQMGTGRAGTAPSPQSLEGRIRSTHPPPSASPARDTSILYQASAPSPCSLSCSGEQGRTCKEKAVASCASVSSRQLPTSPKTVTGKSFPRPPDFMLCFPCSWFTTLTTANVCLVLTMS